MENGNNISEKDRELAQKIGGWLDDGKSLADFPDQDIRSIKQEFNRTDTEEVHPEAPGREEVWRRIAAETQPRANVNRMIFSSSKRVFAAAAAILLAAVFSLVLFMQMDQPELVAESSESILEVSLSDGSIATLRPNSKLYMIDLDEQQHLYRMEGEIYFDVENNPERTFSVESGEAIVHVLGTSFNLRNWSGEAELFLESGSVEFGLTDGTDSVILSPGQRSVISGNRISEPQESDPEMYTSWKRGEFLFRDRAAEYIFSELEHHFGIQITASDSISRERLGGSISLNNRSESLKDLGLVLGGRFVEEEPDTYRFVLTDDSDG